MKLHEVEDESEFNEDDKASDANDDVASQDSQLSLSGPPAHPQPSFRLKANQLQPSASHQTMVTSVDSDSSFYDP